MEILQIIIYVRLFFGGRMEIDIILQNKQLITSLRYPSKTFLTKIQVYSHKPCGPNGRAWIHVQHIVPRFHAQHKSKYN